MRGFTLIELLVVIVLIGIIATMGVLNLTNWVVQREARQEILLLQEQIRWLMDDAVISQLSLALKVNSNHMKIYERKQGGWQESLRNNKGKITLSEGIDLELLNQDGSPRSKIRDNANVDMIYLGSDGRVSPYRLRIADASTYCDLAGDLAGNMQILDCQNKN